MMADEKGGLGQRMMAVAGMLGALALIWMLVTGRWTMLVPNYGADTLPGGVHRQGWLSRHAPAPVAPYFPQNWASGPPFAPTGLLNDGLNPSVDGGGYERMRAMGQ